MIPTAAELRSIIRDHLANSGEAPTALSLRVSKDKNLIRDILGDDRREPRIGLARDILAAIEKPPTPKHPPTQPAQPVGVGA